MEEGIIEFKWNGHLKHQKTILDKYKILEKIGEGTYGSVYKAIDIIAQQEVAIKKIKSAVNEIGIPSTAIREISILKELDHPNIVKLLHVHYLSGKVYLVFEYIHTDLKKLLDQNKTPFSEQETKVSIFHRDIKTMNILITKDRVVKIADFGLARAYQPPMKHPLTHQIVTLWYRAPELMLGTVEYSLGIDIWSLGCIFAEMIDRRPLFASNSEISQLFGIFEVLGTPNELSWPGIQELSDYKPTFPKFKGVGLKSRLPSFSSSALDLIAQMLCLDPKHRINARNALKHKFFEDGNIKHFLPFVYEPDD